MRSTRTVRRSKAAIDTILAAEGIRVNAVSPGLTYADIHARAANTAALIDRRTAYRRSVAVLRMALLVL